VKGEKSGVITHGDSMIAAFTFNLSDLVARLEETSQWKWHGRCKAEIEGEISLNRLNAELTVRNISGCHEELFDSHVAANFEKQAAALELQQELSTAETDDTSMTRSQLYAGVMPEFPPLFRACCGRNRLEQRCWCLFSLVPGC
jgi:hypothetical protein